MLPEQIPPEEEQEETPAPSRASRFVPWLFVLGMALLFVPIYLVSGVIDDTITPLSTEMDILQQTITAPPPIPNDEATLAKTLLDMRLELSNFGDIPTTLSAAHIDWPAITAVIHSYDAEQVRLTTFNNTDTRLTIEGAALQESSVLDYAHNLERTGYFSRVNVQSITLNPVAAPTPNLQELTTPGAPLTETYMPFIFTLTLDLAGATQ